MESRCAKVLVEIYKWKYSGSGGPQHDARCCNGISQPLTYFSVTTRFKKTWSLLIKEKAESLWKRGLQIFS